MQFTFSGKKPIKTLIDGNKPKDISRSAFLLILVIEAIAARQRAAKRKSK